MRFFCRGRERKGRLRLVKESRVAPFQKGELTSVCKRKDYNVTISECTETQHLSRLLSLKLSGPLYFSKGVLQGKLVRVGRVKKEN